MWETFQYLLLTILILLVLLYNTNSLPKFAMYSELVWLIVYTLVVVSGSFVDSPELLSLPFIILVLTAVEAVIVWVLVTHTASLK